MFDPRELDRAVEIARRAYLLLRWVIDGIERGIVTFDEVHEHLTIQEAARRWVHRHMQQFPLDARPDADDVNRFANYFATYLGSSFDLIERPGKVRRTNCGCLCPLCSLLVDAPHLQPKRVTKRDKQHAERLKYESLERLAEELADEPERATDPARLDAILAMATLREEVALLSYGRELLRRCAGLTSGPAVLSLWRQFAWTPQGSPRRGFELRAKSILEAEAMIIRRLGET